MRLIFPKWRNYPWNSSASAGWSVLPTGWEQRATSAAAFTLSVIALWGTLHGYGPFVNRIRTPSVLLMDTS